jgi:chromate transporter
MAPEDFAKLLAVSQVMPGPTICNLSVMFGYRAAGIGGGSRRNDRVAHGHRARPWRRLARVWRASALAQGADGNVRGRRGTDPRHRDEDVRAVPRHVVPISLSVVAFVGVGLMRLPLLAVIAFAAPIGILLAWREHW